MKAFAVEPVHLSGHGVKIEPLTIDHAHAFAEAYRQDLNTYQFFPVLPKSDSIPDVEDFIRLRTQSGDAVQAIFFNDKFVGSSSYMDIRPEHRSLEIGHTWHSQSIRGTVVYPATKLLMLDQALFEWEAIRVQFKTDLRNVASQKAMIKAKFVCEGVHRNHLIMPDGHFRDTIYFSVLPQDYPEIREHLLEMITSRS